MCASLKRPAVWTLGAAGRAKTSRAPRFRHDGMPLYPTPYTLYPIPYTLTAHSVYALTRIECFIPTEEFLIP